MHAPMRVRVGGGGQQQHHLLFVLVMVVVDDLNDVSLLTSDNPGSSQVLQHQHIN